MKTSKELPDLRDVYDMDVDYNLLYWNIPHLDITLKLGQKYSVDGFEQTLIELHWSADMLGIYAMRPIFDNEMIELSKFVSKFENGTIKFLK